MPTSTIAPKARPLPQGVYTPVLTLYKTDVSQEIDYDAMRLHARHLLRSGQHGLVYLGTNGELPLLDRAERIKIVAMAREAVADVGLPAHYPIVAGISAQSTRETILCAREAADAGASFGLLLPPSYWAKAVTPDAMLAYYREVADASPIPIVIYNFPGVTGGIDVDSDHIAALAEHPNIVAVKLTCGNVGKVVRLASKFSPSQFGVYGGSADYLVPTLEGGGVGCVTGMGNVFPRATAAVYDLWRDGKKDEAKKLQELVGNAEWACKKGLALTKFAAWHFIGKKHLGIEERGTFAPRRPYLEPGEAMRDWTVKTMQVLEEAEEAIPLRTFK